MAMISALPRPKLRTEITRATPIYLRQNSPSGLAFLPQTIIPTTTASASAPRNKKGLVVTFASERGPDNGSSNGSGDAGLDDPKKGGRLILNLRWQDLLNPDPENILAVGLTGLLAWASVQVLFQLFFIALAILVAALKYSSIAALLLVILITLL